MARKTKGLSAIEMMAPARMRLLTFGWQEPQRTPKPARMKENSPICARLAGDRERCIQGIAEEQDEKKGGQRLAEDDDGRDYDYVRLAR